MKKCLLISARCIKLKMRFKQAFIRILVFLLIFFQKIMLYADATAVYYHQHSRFSHLARASILSALEIRSSLRINTSTQKAFDTRRSGIRKVHAVYMYPRKIHSTCLNTTWILPRSARSCSRDFILYVFTLHVVFHIDRAESIRIMIIQITRTIHPISWDKSLLYPLIYRMYIP